MTTVTQRIPNFFKGISQQPDNRKFPGQVKDALNVYPDYALGLLKRPGGKYVTGLENATSSGKWFSILRDEVEKYVAQYDNNTFSVWSLIDGSQRRVNMGKYSNVPVTCDHSAYETAKNDYNTAVATRKAALNTLNNAESTYAETLEGTTGNLKFDFGISYDYNTPGQVKSNLLTGILEQEQTIRQATATLSLSNEITGFTVTNGGAGYTNVPTVSITGSGAGAAGTAVLKSLGTFKQVNLDEPGQGYNHRPITTISGGMSDYFSTALSYGFGQSLYGLNVDGKKRIDPAVDTDEIHYVSSGGIQTKGNGSGTGTNGNFKPDQTYTYFGGTDSSAEREIIIKPQDLRNIEKVGVYCFQGGNNNGGSQPTYSYNTNIGTPEYLSLRPHRLIAKFVVKDTEPIAQEWADAENYLLVESFYGGTNSNGIDPEVAVAGDPGLGETFPQYNPPLDSYRPNRVDIVLPESLKQASVWMKIVQPYFPNKNSGWSFYSGNMCLMHIDYIDDYTDVGESTIAIEKNPLSGFVQPTVHATATIVIGRELESITLDAAGSGYDVNTSVLITGGGSSAVAAATPDILQTLTPVVTDAGLGYGTISATIADNGGSGSGAVATVAATNGILSSLSISSGYFGYTNPFITFSTPDRQGGTYGGFIIKKNDQVLNREVTSLTISNTGVGLTDGTYTNVSTTTNNGGTGLTVDITVSGGQVTAATVNQPGSLYWSGDIIYVSGFTNVELIANGLKLGTERTNDHPYLASQGYRVYELGEYTLPTKTAAELTTATNAMTTAQGAYTTAVNDESTKLGLYNTARNACAITELPVNNLKVKSAGSGLANGSYTAQSTSTGGSGSSMTVDLVITDGKVERANINAAGSNYTIGDSITLPSFPGVELVFSREAYLRGATPDDIEFLTLNDFTFVLNKKRIVQMDSELTPPLPNQAQVVIRTVAYNAQYSITIGSNTYSTTTATSTSAGVTDATTIANALVSAVNGGGIYSATKVGPGLIITHSSPFSISTSGSTEQDGLFAFQDTIESVAKLPTQSKNGYKVKVVNSSEIDIDDMWVEFQTSGSGTYGVGSWVECVGPGLPFKFDNLTMPHQLVRRADGHFSFETIDWNERNIGDDNTNPVPSFVGSAISNFFFYRNRLGFLSMEAVILSRAGDFFNFFAKTALTSTDDDPVDIDASTTRPVILNYVRPISVGLVLFGETDQFILSTDSDILSPKTAKINTLSSYESDPRTAAVNMGTTIGFVSKTPLYTRFFELGGISQDQPPLFFDQTNTIPEFIPQTVDSVIASPALSLVSMGTTGTPNMFLYRFLSEGDKRPVSTWFRWQLTGNLVFQFYDLSTLFAVTTDGTTVTVTSYDLTQASEEGFLTLPTGEKTDVCLDQWSVNPYREYDATTKKTRVYLPYDHLSTANFRVIALGGYIGGSNVVSSQSVGAVLEEPVQGSPGNYYVDIDDDYRGRDLIIGYIYTMQVDLPRFYVTKSEADSAAADVSSNLILHRVKVATGLSGPVTYQVNLIGIPSWSNTISMTMPSRYVLNSVNMLASALHEVPIYQRNENVDLKIIGDSPFPVSLLSLNWEGKYTDKFYQRA